MPTLAKYEKKALLFLIATFLIGTSILAYKNIFRQKISIVKLQRSEGKPEYLLININTASAQELTSLPGIGAKLAQRIVEERAKRGKFQRTDELKDVEGIGEAKFDRLKYKITTK